MTATSTLCQEPSTRLHNAIGVIGRVLVSVALVLILLNTPAVPFADMVVFFLPPQPGQHQRAARAPRSVALSPMASKIPKSMAVTWFRASAEQEPVVIFSCILGGLGEGAPFSLSRPHPTPPQEPYSSDLLPASTPRPGAQASSIPPKAPRTQRPCALCLRAAHTCTCDMRHICTSQMHFPDAHLPPLQVFPDAIPAPPCCSPSSSRPKPHPFLARLRYAVLLRRRRPQRRRGQHLVRVRRPHAAGLGQGSG